MVELRESHEQELTEWQEEHSTEIEVCYICFMDLSWISVYCTVLSILIEARVKNHHKAGMEKWKSLIYNFVLELALKFQINKINTLASQ